jgi:C4-dicarboxylate-specific signal transduction histidine kinase
MTETVAVPRPGRILLAEDDPTMRELLIQTLRPAGFDVRACEHGREALAAALEDPPDLVISDLSMPEMDGTEFLQALRADPRLKDLFFIILSAKSAVRDKVGGFESGADDYVAKPFQKLELLARVRSGLRIKSMQDKVKAQYEELKVAHEKLTATQGQLIQAEKMAGLGLLAGGVAHEFNNILGGVIGYCDLALQDGSQAYMKKTVELTHKMLQRAVAITKRLRDFARRQRSEREPCAIARPLDETLDLVKPALEKEGIALVRNFDELPEFPFDVGQLQQVFLNLVINARQAMEGRSDAALSVRLTRDGDFAVIRFRDTGCGIPAANLAKVFDPFFTTKGSFGGGSQQGTGLGLSVSLGIIQSHGGSLTVESDVGLGTTFTIRLPMNRAPVPAAVA